MADQDFMNHVSLPAPDERGAIILLSGNRRSGKTTVLRRVRQTAQSQGLSTGGVLSVARFRATEKVGIDVMDAATGVTFPLAVTGTAGIIHTGRYSFDPAGIAAGLRFAEAGHTADIFFVDELGPLELERNQGWVGVLPLIAARAFGVAFVVVRPELLALARARLGLPDTAPLLLVEPSTRDTLADRLCAWVQQRSRR